MTITDILAHEAKVRIKIADENRVKGIKDPLNDMADALTKILEKGECLMTKSVKESPPAPKDTRSKRQKRLDKKRNAF